MLAPDHQPGLRAVRWLALALACVTSWAMAEHRDAYGIHVTGAGEIVVVPDMATVALEIRRVGPAAPVLKKELDGIVAKVIRMARDRGVAERDITATAAQIRPNTRYEDGRQTIDGVIASRSITLIVRDLEELGIITNAALDAGVNTVGQIVLDTSRRTELEDKALDSAVRDARRLAARLAQGFGVELGRAYDVATVGQRRVAAEGIANVMRSSAPESESISAGEITIRSEVAVSFSILGSTGQ